MALELRSSCTSRPVSTATVPDLRVEVWTLNSEASEDNAGFIRAAKKTGNPHARVRYADCCSHESYDTEIADETDCEAHGGCSEDAVFEWQCEAIQRILKQLGARSPFVHRTPPDLDAELLRALFRACPIVVTRDSQAQNLIASRPAGFSFQPLDRNHADFCVIFRSR